MLAKFKANKVSDMFCHLVFKVNEVTGLQFIENPNLVGY